MNLRDVYNLPMSPTRKDYTIQTKEPVKATIMYISKGRLNVPKECRECECYDKKTHICSVTGYCKHRDEWFYTQEFVVMDDTLDRQHTIYYKIGTKQGLLDTKKELGKEALFVLRAFKGFEHTEGLLCGYPKEVLEERTEI